MVTVEFLSDQVAHISVRRYVVDADFAVVTVSRLSGMTVVVSSTGVTPRPCRLVRTAPAYRHIWTGAASDAERAIYSMSVNPQVTVESPGNVAPLKMHPLWTEPRTVLSVALANASGALLLAVLYPFALVYFPDSENSGLPPPFVEYSAGFRGW